MIAIIDYAMGNAQSIMNAIEAIGSASVLTNNKTEIELASHIILPGVGAFPKAIENLKNLGLIEVLNEQVIEKKKPFLGICLGMQLIAKKSYEGEETEGLGWIDAEVKKFDIKGLKVPHVGWNDVKCNIKTRMFFNSDAIQTFYFVHSYYVKCREKGIVSGECDYGLKFAAAIEKRNIFATQFHPEKSQKDGLEILKKFIGYEGE